MSDRPQKKYTGQNVRAGDHASPYPVSRLAAPISLVDTAKAIESASETVALRTNAQLEVIAEQMRALEHQARSIMAQALQDIDLIQAECRFQRVPGKIYHLYERPTGRRYFSMLAPDEYTQGPPDSFVGSFRYEYGETFTRLDEIDAQDARRQDLKRYTRLLKGSE